MFVRVKKIGGYEYLYLVENVREGGRHVQRSSKHLAAATRSKTPACSTASSLPPLGIPAVPSYCPASTAENSRRSTAAASAPIWRSAISGGRPDARRCCVGIWSDGASASTPSARST